MCSSLVSSISKYKLLITLLLISTPLFVFVAIRVVSTINYVDSDFFTFWLAGWMRWVGQDPYSSEAWINGHKLFGASWVPNPLYPYPLAVSFLFAPLGLFSLPNAFVIWITISLIFVMMTTMMLISMSSNPKKLHLILPLFAGIFMFRPLIVTITNGQFGSFLLLVLGLVVLLWDMDKWWQGSVLLVLLALKPQLGIPIILLISVWLASRQKFSALIVFIIAGMFLFAISTWYDPDWISALVQSGSRKLGETLGYSPTIWGVAGSICGHSSHCTLALGSVLATLLIVGLGYLINRVGSYVSPMVMASLAVPFALLVTPYTWAYDQILLILPITVLSLKILESGYPYLLAATLPILISLISLGLLFIATSFGHDAWSATIPLLCLIFLALIIWKVDSQSKETDCL